MAARLLTREEAELWCSSFDNEMRTKPVVEETRQKASLKKDDWFYPPCEWINPEEDYLSAEIAGYGFNVRLWTDMPTDEQRANTPWDSQ